jgi:glycosyltransferase involved in cell wall biosynthesis
MNQIMDRAEVLGLISACDAYVSPHRAEGFGRTLAEAMLMGKPVVATNYSGNQFFMHHDVTLPVDYELVGVKRNQYHFIENEDEAVWANPSISHLTKQMHKAIEKSKDPQWVALLKAYAQQTFSPSRTGGLLKARLLEIAQQLSARAPANVVKEDQQKIEHLQNSVTSPEDASLNSDTSSSLS